MRIFKNISLFGRLVAFSHSIFAIPFAFLALLAAGKRTEIHSLDLLLIVVALVSARTAAMGWNRILDAEIDKNNPRTKDREIPKGEVSIKSAKNLVLFSVLIFFLSSFGLGLDCLLLSPIVLLVLLGYSYSKRFTHHAHLVLGLSLALAPGGAWYAITHQFSLVPIPLMLAVLLWVAGFDIIYSCQDCEFDARSGLYSIPVKYGVEKALFISRVLHGISILFLIFFGIIAELGVGYWIGLIVFTVLIFSQHTLLSPRDLSRVNKVFFTRNGWASVFLCILTVIGMSLER